MKVYAEEFLELSTDLLLIGRLDGFYHKSSERLKELLGWNEIDLSSRPLWEFFHPDDQSAVKSSLAKLLTSESVLGFECRILTKSGDYRWTSWNGKISRQDPSLFLAIGKDIHAQKEWDAFYKLFFESSTVGFNLCSMDGTWIESNQAFLKIIGYSKQEADGSLTYWQLTPKKYKEMEAGQLKMLSEKGIYGPYEKEFIRKDGTLIPVRLNGFIIERNGQQFIWSIIEDITERKKLEVELRGAIEVRDEFLSIASHELRTPLSSLALQLELLKRFLSQVTFGPSDNAEKILMLANKANVSCDQLGELLNELLDITRIRAGKLVLNKVKMDLRLLVEHTVSQMSEEIKKSGSSIILENPEAVWGVWDPKRIGQVISNLISNALKYGEGKDIHISIAIDLLRQKAILKVKDEGMGIPTELQETIFRRFERGVSGEKISGLGLGLYIVEQILRSHDGSIRVESENKNGSLFVVELPL